MLIIHCFNSSHIFPKWHPSPKLSSFIKTILPYLSFQDLIYSNLNCIWHLNGINRKLETLTSSWSLINNSGLPKILWFWGSSIYQFFPSISIQLFEDGDHRTGHLNINCIEVNYEGKKFKMVRFLVFCSCSRKLLPFRSGILLKPAKINANR